MWCRFSGKSSCIRLFSGCVIRVSAAASCALRPLLAPTPACLLAPAPWCLFAPAPPGRQLAVDRTRTPSDVLPVEAQHVLGGLRHQPVAQLTVDEQPLDHHAQMLR